MDCPKHKARVVSIGLRWIAVICGGPLKGTEPRPKRVSLSLSHLLCAFLWNAKNASLIGGHRQAARSLWRYGRQRPHSNMAALKGLFTTLAV